MVGRRKEEGGIVSWAKVVRALPPSLVIPSPRAASTPRVSHRLQISNIFKEPETERAAEAALIGRAGDWIGGTAGQPPGK